ncbi:hypothetical protein ACFL52_04580 [Candidatus Margulisiibacteriota bacterium]
MKRLLEIFFLLIIICIANSSVASVVEGTNSYPKYFIVLVHGIGGNIANWTNRQYSDIKNIDINDISNYSKYDGFKKYLEKPTSQGGLGLKGYVYAYTFSAPCGDAKNNSRELGDRNHYNPAPEMGGLCWLEKAKSDYISNFRKLYGRSPNHYEIPDKYILVAHSMGNYAVRGYIYSDQLGSFYDKGFYQNDIDKVVFVDAVLKGSTAAYVPYMTAFSFGLNATKVLNNMLFKNETSFSKTFMDWYKTISMYDQVNIAKGYIQDQLLGNDIFGPYQVAADISGAIIVAPRIQNIILFMLLNIGYNAPNVSWGGLSGLLPVSDTVRHLNGVNSLDPEFEPSYSIVYGSGIPLFEPYGTAAKEVISFLRGNNVFDINNGLSNFFLNLDYQKMTLVHPAFYNLPTNQARFLSLLMSRFGAGFYTNDGDGVVDLASQKGEGISYLRNAPRHKKMFKSESFDNYLTNQFPAEVAATEAVMAAAALAKSWSGIPYPIAWKSLWWMRFIPATSLISKVYEYREEINYSIEAHGNILKENEILSKAILDSPAITTVLDIQTTWEAVSISTPEASASSLSATGTPEVKYMSITAPRTAPAGYQSIKIKSLQENRVYHGNTNMSIPITVDGKRKYMTEMLVTKPPKRIEGKLNYLVPKLMQQFQYSFNHKAWTDIKNVNPVTGEFVLDNLPFAEGQNTLAIRATNAVGVKSHQICKFVLNTIPMVISKMTPKPNSYTNNPRPTMGGTFAKSVYTENTKLGEGIPTVTSAKLYWNDKLLKDLLNDPNFKQENVKVNDYRTEVNFSYRPPEPLKDGQYKLVVEAKSEVGTSRGEWPFWVDTTPPTITIQLN